MNAAALTGELLTAAGAVAGGGPPLPEAVDIAKVRELSGVVVGPLWLL